MVRRIVIIVLCALGLAVLGSACNGVYSGYDDYYAGNPYYYDGFYSGYPYGYGYGYNYGRPYYAHPFVFRNGERHEFHEHREAEEHRGRVGGERFAGPGFTRVPAPGFQGGHPGHPGYGGHR